MLFIRWYDTHSAGTRKKAIVEDHPFPFRALASEEKLWSNIGIDKVVANFNGQWYFWVMIEVPSIC